MQGVVYRESDEDTWPTLGRHGASVRDHFATIGVDVVVDEAEGYAYLRRTRRTEGEEPLPRLVRRRALTYNVSLLLVLLRKRLVEFETSGGEGQLVLTPRPDRRDAAALPRRLHQRGAPRRPGRHHDRARRPSSASCASCAASTDQWEVRRILKAYVDAQTLSDFAGKLPGVRRRDPGSRRRR